MFALLTTAMSFFFCIIITTQLATQTVQEKVFSLIAFYR